MIKLRGVLLLVGLGLAGCMPLPVKPPDQAPPAKDPPAKGLGAAGSRVRLQSAAAAAKVEDAAPRSLLADAAWTRVPRGAAVQPRAEAFRWRSASLDEVQARRVGLLPFLADPQRPVAINAAIGLGRAGDPAGLRRLVDAAAAADLPRGMRCAAVEALAALATPLSLGPLQELTDQFGDPGPAGVPAYRTELHAELVRGLARHIDAADDPRLSAALTSPAAEVRLEALRAWGASQRGSLSREAAELRKDGDPLVRAAALTAIAARNVPQAQRLLADALTDIDLGVRLAAIAALGQLGDSQSRAILTDLLKDRSDRIRAEAVAALDHAGAEATVLAAAGDTSWRVRLKVAQALAAHPDRESLATARRLLDDPSAEVERQLVLSVAKWPLPQSGPVLLEALSKPALWTRKTAAGELAARWPPAAEFPADAAPSRRQEILGELEARFHRQFVSSTTPGGPAASLPGAGATGPMAEKGDSPHLPERPGGCFAQMGTVPFFRPASVSRVPDAAAVEEVQRLLHCGDMKALGQWGPELVEILDHLATKRHQAIPEAVYRDVLPGRSEAFATLARLQSQSVTERRRAAEDLARLAQKQPLGSLATARLCQVVTAEPDALVWQAALEAVAADPAEPAVRLARTALGHAAPEIRRRGCEYLAAHPDRGHVKQLVPLLEDGSHAVVVAAVRALGAIDLLDDLQPLRRLLGSSNEVVQLEAAVVLARCHDPAGRSALERLSFSGDPRTRTRLAQAIGELGDSSLVPVLIRLVDDPRGSVSHAALLALPKLAGRDVARPGDAPVDTDEQIRRWKRWAAGGALSVAD